MVSTTSTSQPKRRWFRWSLRSFLIAVGSVSVWIGWYVNQAERQRRAVRWATENGAAVFYDFEIDANGNQRKNARSPVPAMVRGIVDVSYFSNAVAVSVYDEHRFRNLSPLTGMGKLVSLEFTMGYISSSGIVGPIHEGYSVSSLEPLQSMTSLETLRVPHTRVRDVTPLKGLHQLRELNLDFTPVSDLEPLSEMQSLVHLSIDHTKVSDLTTVGRLENLVFLSIDGVHADLSPLYQLKNLRELWISPSGISDDEIDRIRKALPKCVIERGYTPVG